MGLYNVLSGTNPIADVLLATLHLTRQDTGRFRDAFAANGEIAIYTRNGGGNREEYQHVFDELSKHPCYLRDEDDSYDCTYATIFFKYPDEFAEDLKRIELKEEFNPSARWKKLLDALKNSKS